MTEEFTDHELETLENDLRDRLNSYITKTPSSKETHQLINQLQSVFDDVTSPDMTLASKRQQTPLLTQWLWQTRQMSVMFWMVSVLLFGMLTLIVQTAGLNGNQFHQGIFSYTPPVYVLVAVIYTFNTWNKELRTVEMITPYPPALLLLLRMINVLAVNVVLGLLGTGYLRITGESFSTFAFLLSWLAPTLLMFSVLAFVMYKKDITASICTALVTWFIYMILPEVMTNFFAFGYDAFKVFQITVMVLCTALLISIFTKARQDYDFQT